MATDIDKALKDFHSGEKPVETPDVPTEDAGPVDIDSMLRSHVQAEKGLADELATPEETPLQVARDQAKENLDNVAQEERYTPQKGFVGSLLEALDYPGNIGRSALLGASREGASALDYAKEAATKQRYTPSSLLRQQWTENLKGTGLEGLTQDYGENNGKFDLGDVPDVARDFAIDFVTDPVNIALMGSGRLVTGAVKRLGPTALKETAAAGVSSAKKAQQVSRVVGSAGVGAMAFGGADADTPIEARLALSLGAAGATYGLKSPVVGKYVKAMATKGADSIVDLYHTIRTGKNAGEEVVKDAKTGFRVIPGVSQSERIAHEASDKINAIADATVQARLEALKGLSPGERARVSEIMQERVGSHVLRRNQELLASPDLPYRQMQDRVTQLKDFLNTSTDEAANKLAAKELKSTQRQMRIMWNETTARIAKDMDPKSFYQAMVADEGERIANAVEAWRQNNDAFVEQINREVYGLETGKWDPRTGRGIEGLSYHIDNPGFQQEQKLLDEAMAASEKELQRRAPKIHAKLQTERNINLKDWTADETYAAYAHKIARSFLKPQELDAFKKVAEIRAAPGFDKFEKMLSLFDWHTSRVKSNLLLLSTSWLKNNYPDNLLKAYAENGLFSAATAAMFGRRKGLLKDIWSLSSDAPKFDYLYKSPYTKDMLERGVISKNFFTEKKALQDFLFTPKLQKEAAEAAKPTWYKAGAKAWKYTAGWVEQNVGRAGSVIEDSARAVTYIDTLKKLKLVPGVTEEMAKDIAAKVVSTTFFDYGKVHALEKAVMKRVIPFYTFYSRNIPYWAGTLTSAKGIQRIANYERVVRNIGHQPLEKERARLPMYMLQNPRILSGGAGEDMRVLSFPSNSYYDALNMVDPKNLGLGGNMEAFQKLNPTLKTLLELGTNTDTFFGGPVYPSQTKKGQISAGMAGYKNAWANKKLEDAGVPEVLRDLTGFGGSYIDPTTHKSVQTSDRGRLWGKVWSTAMPLPAVNQVSSMVLKPKITGKEDENTWFNLLMSPQILTVPPEEQAKSKKANRLRR